MSSLKAIQGIVSTVWAGNRGCDRVFYLARAALWQLRKRLGQSFLATLPSGAKIRVLPNGVFSGVFYSKWFEHEEIIFLRAKSFLAPTFVDVGANVGLYSAYLFDRYRKFILFEPSPSTFRALEENCRLNPSVETRPLNLAVGDRPGELAFIDEGGLSAVNRVPMSSETAKANSTVPVTTLDAVLGPDSGPIVLKVDVEGMEERVFLGASDLLSSQKVRLLTFERLGRSDLGAIQKLLEGFGYKLFLVTPGGKVSDDPEALSRPLINIFAAPQDVWQGLK